jgi:hypothetical protein
MMSRPAVVTTSTLMHPAMGTLPWPGYSPSNTWGTPAVCRNPLSRSWPRTWTAAGWMYTPGQLRYAVSLAESMRKRRGRASRPRLKLVDGQG